VEEGERGIEKDELDAQREIGERQRGAEVRRLRTKREMQL
jgi:hypothetical protein